MKVIKVFPSNGNYEDIFMKVNLVNSAFKTRIGDTVGLSKIIFKNVQNIDKRLKDGGLKLIVEIGKYQNSKVEVNFYSFATKYCHVHSPNNYVIFDRYVAYSLIQFSKCHKNTLSKVKQKNLRNYSLFLEVIIEFKTVFNLTVDNASLDRFLWSLGRNEFKKLGI